MCIYIYIYMNMIHMNIYMDMNIRMHNKPDLVLLNISVQAVYEDWRNAEGICIGYVCV